MVLLSCKRILEQIVFAELRLPGAGHLARLMLGQARSQTLLS